MLYYAQCILYMVDISNSESFNIIKQLVALLKPDESYITNILVLNLIFVYISILIKIDEYIDTKIYMIYKMKQIEEALNN